MYLTNQVLSYFDGVTNKRLPATTSSFIYSLIKRIDVKHVYSIDKERVLERFINKISRVVCDTRYEEYYRTRDKWYNKIVEYIFQATHSNLYVRRKIEK